MFPFLLAQIVDTSSPEGPASLRPRRSSPQASKERETECGSLGLGGDHPSVPFSSLRKLLLSLMLPSKLPFSVEDMLRKPPK